MYKKNNIWKIIMLGLWDQRYGLQYHVITLATEEVKKGILEKKTAQKVMESLS